MASDPHQPGLNTRISNWPGSVRNYLQAVFNHSPQSSSASAGPLTLERLFGQHFLVCPFAWRDRIFWIHTHIWPVACVDTHPTSCAQRLAFTGKQKTRVVHDALQLREHITGNKVLAHRQDGVGL